MRSLGDHLDRAGASIVGFLAQIPRQVEKNSHIGLLFRAIDSDMASGFSDEKSTLLIGAR
jgi:hypothetical protein